MDAEECDGPQSSTAFRNQMQSWVTYSGSFEFKHSFQAH